MTRDEINDAWASAMRVVVDAKKAGLAPAPEAVAVIDLIREIWRLHKVVDYWRGEAQSSCVEEVKA